MRRVIILSSVASLAPPCFSTLSHERRDFRDAVVEHKMCDLIFSTNFIWNISDSENSARYCHKCKNVSMESTSYSCHISVELGISCTDVRKIPKYPISKKSVQWEPSCSMRTDRHDEVIVAFRNFAVLRLDNPEKYCSVRSHSACCRYHYKGTFFPC